jgi:hypothetical protein
MALNFILNFVFDIIDNSFEVINMRIAIVGGGASGVLAGILLKMYRPEYEVTIYEQNDRVLKKLLSTGNGMCNFDNINSNDANNYNNELIKDLINKYDYKFIVSLFKELGIASFILIQGKQVMLLRY